MKRFTAMVLAMLLMIASAQATILPSTGVDEGFAAWTGIECTPGVVLCESLSVLDARGDQGGRKVATLYYTGESIPVIESWDGYAKVYYADGTQTGWVRNDYLMGTQTGWVRNDYLMLDPAWYICDTDMQVYAYPDVMAPRVALLDKGTKLPILTEYEDGESISGWVCVSLRGAAGWIRKTPKDTVDNTWFRPEQLTIIESAQLTFDGRTRTLTDANALGVLGAMLVNVEDRGGMVAGCPFGAELTLQTETGKVVTLALATDSCCIYRVDGRDYAYARHLMTEEGSPDNMVLYRLFGMTEKDLYPWME